MFKSINLLTKLMIVIVTFIVTYYGLSLKVDKFEKYETVFACDFIEQFVQIYHMDKICNNAFSDGIISKSEFWSVTWRFKTIVRTWESKKANGEGNPALKKHAYPPIKRRVLPLPNSLEMPGLKEVIERAEKLNDENP